MWGGFAVLCVGVVSLAWSLLPGMAARWVFTTLETDWGIVGRAGQVDLNPVRLEVRVQVKCHGSVSGRPASRS